MIDLRCGQISRDDANAASDARVSRGPVVISIYRYQQCGRRVGRLNAAGHARSHARTHARFESLMLMFRLPFDTIPPLSIAGGLGEGAPDSENRIAVWLVCRNHCSHNVECSKPILRVVGAQVELTCCVSIFQNIHTKCWNM